jgi:pyridoxal phosphate enzyme (YggS family)
MKFKMITENLHNVQKTLVDGVTLIAVSKTKPASDIQTLYNAGQRAFGENKVQELVEKYEELPKDIQWHLIGHLQTNKVKYIAPFVHLIHGVDSFKLLKEINKEAIKHNRVIPCLLQFHIAQEETKFGFSFEEAQEMLESNEFVELQHVSVHGVMSMASFTEDKNQIHEEFQSLHNYFQLIKSHYFKFNPEFKELSMGMSGDYKIAMEEGSTMVRVGSTIFGTR